MLRGRTLQKPVEIWIAPEVAVWSGHVPESGWLGVVADLAAIEHPLELYGERHYARNPLKSIKSKSPTMIARRMRST